MMNLEERCNNFIVNIIVGLNIDEILAFKDYKSINHNFKYLDIVAKYLPDKFYCKIVDDILINYKQLVSPKLLKELTKRKIRYLNVTNSLHLVQEKDIYLELEQVIKDVFNGQFQELHWVFGSPLPTINDGMLSTTSLTSVHIEYAFNLNLTTLLAEGMPSLDTLKLNHIPDICDVDFFALIYSYIIGKYRNLQSIKHLDFSCCCNLSDFTIATVMVLFSDSLQSINMFQTMITPVSFLCLTKYCPTLYDIIYLFFTLEQNYKDIFSMNKQITNYGLLYYLISYFGSNAELDFLKIKLLEEKSFSETFINLLPNKTMSNNFLKFLHSISLDNKKVENTKLVSINTCFPFKRAENPNENSISFSFETSIFPKNSCIIEALKSNSNTLNEFMILGWDDVDDELVKNMSIYCPKLKKISLSSCTNITEESVSAISKFKCLQELRIKEAITTPLNLQTIVESCHKLQCLKLDGIILNDELMYLLAKSNLPNKLEILSVRWLEGVSGKALSNLLKRCHNLRVFRISTVSYDAETWITSFSNANNIEYLEITGTESGLNDEIVSMFSLQFNNIKELDISWAYTIIDKTIVEVLRNCAVLETLIVEGLKLITSSPFQKLINDFDNLILANVPYTNMLHYWTARSSTYGSKLNMLNCTYCDLVADKDLKLIFKFAKGTIDITTYNGESITFENV